MKIVPDPTLEFLNEKLIRVILKEVDGYAVKPTQITLLPVGKAFLQKCLEHHIAGARESRSGSSPVSADILKKAEGAISPSKESQN